MLTKRDPATPLSIGGSRPDIGGIIVFGPCAGSAAIGTREGKEPGSARAARGHRLATQSQKRYLDRPLLPACRR
jgi:hypothetical protein